MFASANHMSRFRARLPNGYRQCTKFEEQRSKLVAYDDVIMLFRFLYVRVEQLNPDILPLPVEWMRGGVTLDARGPQNIVQLTDPTALMVWCASI